MRRHLEFVEENVGLNEAVEQHQTRRAGADVSRAAILAMALKYGDTFTATGIETMPLTDATRSI